MPVHDWSRVDAGIFHDFHHAWIEQIKRALNGGVLPAEFYALAEQRGAGFIPDVLTLETVEPEPEPDDAFAPLGGGRRRDDDEGGVATLEAEPEVAAGPTARVVAEVDPDWEPLRPSVVAVRHASGDRLVAVVEIVSRGNKAGREAFAELVDTAVASLRQGIHLLLIDLQPTTPRDPDGLHGAIWADLLGPPYQAPPGEPLTLASYEAGEGRIRAFVEPLAVGAAMADLPLFLRPRRHVRAPLARTYDEAFAALPRRWQSVLQPA